MKSIPRPPSLKTIDKVKADTICKWFEQWFTDPSVVPLSPFVNPGQPLNQPITASEVESTMKLIQNGRAPGSDGVSNELLKYAARTLSKHFAEIINAIFKQHIALEALGKGILVALPISGKPLGPLTSLLPIVLLNNVRKIVSIIILQCIRPKVNAFTGTSQSGFKQGRSCADIVRAQRKHISVVMIHHWDFHKMGIDMSRTFDTINREKILDVLISVGCEVDDLRLVRILLTGTNITFRVRSSWSA